MIVNLHLMINTPLKKVGFFYVLVPLCKGKKVMPQKIDVQSQMFLSVSVSGRGQTAAQPSNRMDPPVGIVNSTLAFSTTQKDFSNTERSNLCHIPNDDLISLSKVGLTPGTAAVKDMHPPCEGLHLP